MKRTHAIYGAIASFGVIAFFSILIGNNEGINLSRSSDADSSYGLTISSSDFEDTFVKHTKIGNPITFHFQNNTLRNETMLTGLNQISFSSLNKGILLSTGYDAEEYLYERYLLNDESNSFTINLVGEGYFGITCIDQNETLNLENLDFGYSCSMSNEEYFDSRLKFTYVTKTSSFSVEKKSGFTSTDKNKDCLIPRYYIDQTHGKCPVTTVASSGFNGCYLQNAYIPSTITKLDNLAFSQCFNLTSVYVPDSVTTFGYSVFSKCSKLKNVRLSENLKTVGDTTFENCSQLEKIHLPDSITTLGSNIFSNCKLLSEVNCPRGIKKLETSVFYYTNALTSFTITSNVTSLSTTVFRNCSSLEKIYFEGTMERWNIICPEGCYSGCPLLKTISCEDGDILL